MPSWKKKTIVHDELFHIFKPKYSKLYARIRKTSTAACSSNVTRRMISIVFELTVGVRNMSEHSWTMHSPRVTFFYLFIIFFVAAKACSLWDLVLYIIIDCAVHSVFLSLMPGDLCSFVIIYWHIYYIFGCSTQIYFCFVCFSFWVF